LVYLTFIGLQLAWRALKSACRAVVKPVRRASFIV